MTAWKKPCGALILATILYFCVVQVNGLTTANFSCNNKVGCYHCQLGEDCHVLDVVNSRLDQHSCYELCESTVECTGIQFDYNTTECRLFGVDPLCQNLNYAPGEVYVYKRSCRTECSFMTLLHIPGWSYNSTYSSYRYYPANQGECVNRCFNENGCLGALFLPLLYVCQLYLNCSFGCILEESTDQQFILNCTEECGGLSHPTNGHVKLEGTFIGASAEYVCDAGFQLNGASRVCGADGLWSGSEATCVPATTTGDPCDNKVGCYHCEIEAACVPLDTVPFNVPDQHVCYLNCEYFTACMGIQFNYTTKMCLRFGYSHECRRISYTTDEIYVYRKSCRTVLCPDCSLVEMVFYFGSAYGKDAEYESLTTNNQGDCLGECFETSGCEGAVFVPESSHCRLFVGCTVDSTIGPSIGHSQFVPECRQECSILYNPPNGLVTLQATVGGHFAEYQCNSGFHLVGDSSRMCGFDGQWIGPEPTCNFGPPEIYSSSTVVSSASQSISVGATTSLLSTRTETSIPTPVATSLPDTISLSTRIQTSKPTSVDISSTGFTSLSTETASTPSTIGTTIKEISLLSAGIATTSTILTPTTLLPSGTSVRSTLESAGTATPLPITAVALTQESSLLPSGVATASSLSGTVVVSPVTVLPISVTTSAAIIMPPITSINAGMTTSHMPSSTPIVSATVSSKGQFATYNPPKPIYIMPCLCSTNSFYGLTEAEIIAQLVNDVRINTEATQLAVSKKVCMKDSRHSSISMGVLGVALVSTCAGLIVVLDLVGKKPSTYFCCKHVRRKLRRNRVKTIMPKDLSVEGN